MNINQVRFIEMITKQQKLRNIAKRIYQESFLGITLQVHLGLTAATVAGLDSVALRIIDEVSYFDIQG